MTELDDMLDEFSEPVREKIQATWRALPDEQRLELHKLLGVLPGSVKPLKDILALVLDQYRPLGTKQRIAIVGPANVGKSTLYNQLIFRKEDAARVSPVPGTTRMLQTAETGLFQVIDTPGADAVGEVGVREREIAFEAAQNADFLVIVFEATRGIKRYEKDLFDDLLALGKPYLVVLNKLDLVPGRDQEQVLQAAARNLRLEPSQVVGTIATKGTHVERVILAITKFEPRLLAAVAEALPEYRSRLAWQRIAPASAAAGVVGLVPLPFIDLIPLLGIQVGLVLSIARIYGFQITPARARELIATFGVGLMGRTLFQQLSKLGTVPGWILSAAVASATTAALGYGAVAWFGYGQRLSRHSLQQLAAEITAYLKEQLAELGDHRPDKGTLRERISRMLENIPRHLQPADRLNRFSSPDHGNEQANTEQPLHAGSTHSAL